jgi:hypothetical protein
MVEKHVDTEHAQKTFGRAREFQPSLEVFTDIFIVSFVSFFAPSIG